MKVTVGFRLMVQIRLQFRGWGVSSVSPHLTPHLASCTVIVSAGASYLDCH